MGAGGLVGGAEVEVCAVGEDAGDEMMEEGSEKVELAAEWRRGDVLGMGYAACVIDTDGSGRNKGIRGIRGFCARRGGEDEEADVGGEAGAEDGELGGGVDGMGVVTLAETTFDYGHEAVCVVGLFDREGEAGGGVEDAAAQLVGGERVGEGDGLADVDVGGLSSEAVEGVDILFGWLRGIDGGNWFIVEFADAHFAPSLAGDGEYLEEVGAVDMRFGEDPAAIGDALMGVEDAVGGDVGREERHYFLAFARHP